MTAYVLMTAMPPTTGHLDLIRFAETLAGDDGVTVLINTQPGEPFCEERVRALGQAVHGRGSRVHLVHHHRMMEQDPEEFGFRARWQGVMWGLGAKEGDLLVSSETYGKWLAESTGMTWMPYDIAREINPVRATEVRSDPSDNWLEIIPEFRKHLQYRVTIFGAESTGKTTLARELARQHYAYFLPEYARPYLENTVNEITTRSMTAIWKGQAALQRQPFLNSDLIVQDTDLYSTWGYWKYWMENVDWTKTDLKPRLPFFDVRPLQQEAKDLASDLYIVLPSNVDFEADPLRYGITEREIDDDWWVSVLIQEAQPFHVLKCDPEDRVKEAWALIEAGMKEKAGAIAYDRRGH